MGFSEKPADYIESDASQSPMAISFFHWLTVFLLVFFAVVMITPFIWLLSSSLKTQINIFQYPPQLIPDPIVPENYLYALTYKPFGTYFRNTMLVAGLNVIAVVFTSSFCAYGFARMRFPGRDFWFGIVMATLFLPYAVLLVPSFIVFSRLGWVDTFLPLVVPPFFGGGAFNIFLMRQFFRTIPEEIADAARIDGCSEFGVYWRVMLPLSKPALITIGIFTFPLRLERSHRANHLSAVAGQFHDRGRPGFFPQPDRYQLGSAIGGVHRRDLAGDRALLPGAALLHSGCGDDGAEGLGESAKPRRPFPDR